MRQRWARLKVYGRGGGYFEGCGSPLCDVSHNDFRVVILEYPQQACQVVVASRLAG
jgi:hypothetical protein